MPRFILIDHSLCRVGGHEYDYAVNVVRSAEASGYAVALGVNRRFRDRSGLPERWPVYPVFPHTAHTKHCVSMGGHDHLPAALNGGRLPLATDTPGVQPSGKSPSARTGVFAEFRRRFSRRHRIRGFAQACKRVFEKIGLSAGDQVFLATFTEFDLLGLTTYLIAHPESRLADWHLQFHFDLFEGCRKDEENRRERMAVVRRQFRYALDLLTNHRTYLYTTTDDLAAQYDELGVGSFGGLPYPVNPALQLRAPSLGNVLRVTCAGGMRREKGIRQLGSILKSLRSESYFDSKIEIAAQITRLKLQRIGVSDISRNRDRADVRVLCLPYPLEIDSYHELIRQTDIGLFLYDKHRYHVRCSGILQEMLAAGKPVIVPAGCWLAGQVAEPIARHVERLRSSLPSVGLIRHDDISWTVARRATGTGHDKEPGVLTAGDPTFTDTELAATELAVPGSATELVMAFRRAGTIEAGTYVGMRTEQFDRDGILVDRFESVVGCRSGNRSVPTLLHLDPRTARVAVRLYNPYQRDRLAVTDFEVEFLDSQQVGGCPAGRVGLIAAGYAQVPRLLREMVERYDHYRESAERFSHVWLQTHDPARTIDILTANGASDNQVVLPVRRTSRVAKTPKSFRLPKSA